VLGTMGEVPESIRLIQTAADADEVRVADPSKVAYLMQTTLSVDDAARIVERLRERFPQIVGPARDDICYATQNRQEAVRRLAGQADLALVVGSRNSSNSQRLAELAQACGVPAHLIDGPKDIELRWFSGGETVVLTAGASAPEALVQACVKVLQKHFNAQIETCAVCEEQMRFALPNL
jgi:4-hydroxy-3-methylbut-2-en-1-yl diphosphate reductase